MLLHEGLNTVAGREATFAAPVQLAKRRNSSAKGKKTATTVSWPHVSPTPDQLARAGFFYKPSCSSADNTQCFLCEKTLDGWEESDYPAFEHRKHSPECGWAINVYIQEKVAEDSAYEEEDPLSERMVEARAATFQDQWPHEKKKGWKCKTKKLVEAGWCYNPTPESDDYTTCFHCNLSLDGWEPKDDPSEEHQRRSPDCSFFMLCDKFAEDRQSSKGKRARDKRWSKASRLSIQSNMTAASEAPSMLSAGDTTATTADVDDSIMSTASNATGKGRKRSAKPRARSKATKKTTRKPKHVEETSITELSIGFDSRIPKSLRFSGRPSGLDLDDSLSLLPQAPARETYEKIASHARSDAMDLDQSVASQGPSKKLTGRRAKAKIGECDNERSGDETKGVKHAVATSVATQHPHSSKALRSSEASKQEDTAPGLSQEPMKPARARTAKKAQTRKASEDASQLLAELQAEVDKEESSTVQEQSQLNRGKKRTSGGVPKVAESSVVIEDSRTSTEATRAKRGRPKKGIKLAGNVNSSQVSVEVAAIPQPAPATKNGARPTRKAAKKDLFTPPPAMPGSMPRSSDISVNTSLIEVAAAEKPVASHADMKVDASEDKILRSTVHRSSTPGAKHATPEPPGETTPETGGSTSPSPTPIAPRSSLKAIAPLLPPRSSPLAIQQRTNSHAAPSPSPSEQSSDAENQPPSSRHSLHPGSSAKLALSAAQRFPPPPQSPTRHPLSPSFTNNTGRSSTARAETPSGNIAQSPSKRGVIYGGISSSTPWQAIDIDAALLLSPQSKSLHQYADREINGIEALKEKGLTSPERKMTVEQWVRWNASRAEEKLRNECEGLVAAFEKEGVRAMGVLEGIECL